MNHKYKRKEPSDVLLFRQKWDKKGYHLVNITPLCEARMGCSGWCNDFDEPDETCHHLQITYRKETIANAHFKTIDLIDDDKYVLWNDGDDGDFIIFMKVKK
jgi:hypothetical protein